MKKQFVQIIILFFPIIYIVWGIFINHIAGPFYLTRIDPDYQYLLNGLNCAIIEFDRINHVDHPGTPFQVISGIFIQIIHLFSGSESIVEDVYKNPEKYLSISSFFLTVITAWVLLWLGNTVYKLTRDLFGALVLQSSLFFSAFLSDIPFRYIPDRLLIILMLLFIGLCIKYFYGTLKEKKFTILSGIIMGMGFITKFVFLPFLVIPFIVIRKVKYKIIYLVSLFVSSIAFFLPVYDKYEHFTTFIAGIISHDGLYGGGKSQVFNPDIITDNLNKMMLENMVFFALFLVSIIIVIVFIAKPALRKKNKHEFLFLVAIIIASIGTFVMVAKHYKSYYLVSLLSAGAFIFYLFYRISKNFALSKYSKYLFYIILVWILYMPLPWMNLVIKNRIKHVEEYQQTANTLNKIISNQDYTFMEANWRSGPFVTNGMVWALSYIDHVAYFYNQYEKIYPNHLTWEGQNNPIKYARMIDADNEAILKSGKSIYIYSAPGRYSRSLIDYLRIQEANFNIPLVIDTVFSNLAKEQYLIRARNTDWFTKIDISSGFEKIYNNYIYSEAGKEKFIGEFSLNTEEVCNGFNSIKLGNEYTQSPKMILQNVKKGDYFELTIRRRKNHLDNKGRLVIGFEDENKEPIYYTNEEKLSSVSSDWEIVRLSGTIETQPKFYSVVCYYQYTGSSEVYIDDFTIKHFGRK